MRVSMVLLSVLCAAVAATWGCGDGVEENIPSDQAADYRDYCDAGIYPQPNCACACTECIAQDETIESPADALTGCVRTCDAALIFSDDASDIPLENFDRYNECILECISRCETVADCEVKCGPLLEEQ